jgi:hypothetical protein
MLALVATIIIQAVSRFTSPIAVQGEAVTAVASLGLGRPARFAGRLGFGDRNLDDGLGPFTD